MNLSLVHAASHKKTQFLCLLNWRHCHPSFCSLLKLWGWSVQKAQWQWCFSSHFSSHLGNFVRCYFRGISFIGFTNYIQPLFARSSDHPLFCYSFERIQRELEFMNYQCLPCSLNMPALHQTWWMSMSNNLAFCRAFHFKALLSGSIIISIRQRRSGGTKLLRSGKHPGLLRSPFSALTLPSLLTQTRLFAVVPPFSLHSRGVLGRRQWVCTFSVSRIAFPIQVGQSSVKIIEFQFIFRIIT